MPKTTKRSTGQTRVLATMTDISKASTDLVDALDAAAQTWGWERDIGYDDQRLENTLREHQRTKVALLQPIARLEARHRW